MTAASSVVVVAGGGRVRDEIHDEGAGALVIAADGGADEALRVGLHVDILVGDLDSVTPEGLRAVEEAGAAVHRHPVDKDRTDLELALAEAVEAGAPRILVAGGDRGRFDFVLGNALVLADPGLADVEVDAWFGEATVHVVRSERRIPGRQGDLLSLVAVGGPARGVRTEGLRWALDGQDLPAGVGLGISNEFLGDTALVELREGVLLAIRPGRDLPEA
jgi:thiamine pyrophosphokinase